ncbi:MAG: formyltransferase family protein [Dehalococcoidales bacterium]|jgi:folate-dependent phosphoribosylglycinamide formyltransferase PurN|nr:formyltransferase family protein [Dehalococcoidales bacterium]
MYHFGWFSTGRGEGSRELLKVACNGIKNGQIKNAEISFVFCSREPGESSETDIFIELVKSLGIPIICLSYQRFKSNTDSDINDAFSQLRLEYDRRVMNLLKGYHPDLCVLAGYMLIAGKEMCEKFNMLNLHPAAPKGPTGTWREVIWQLIGTKACETGVMMHLVTPELDRGPVVSYCTYPIVGENFDIYWQEIRGKSIPDIKMHQGEDNKLFKTIREYGLKREFPLILATMAAFSLGEVLISNGEVINANGNDLNGYNLTSEIEKLLKGKD